jgi:hypothetical protein
MTVLQDCRTNLERVNHTVGVKVAGPEIIEVAIPLNRYKQSTNFFYLLLVAGASHKTDVITLDYKMLCNTLHRYNMAGYWRAAYNHDGFALCSHCDHEPKLTLKPIVVLDKRPSKGISSKKRHPMAALIVAEPETDAHIAIRLQHALMHRSSITPNHRASPILTGLGCLYAKVVS